MDAAASSRPDWVIKSAQAQAEAIMNAGKADRYTDAVSGLRRAKDVYTATGRQAGWSSYLARIREQHGRKWKLMGLMKGL